MNNEMGVESFLIVNVKKWIIDYDTRTIEIESNGYKILEEEFINFDTVIANTIQFGKQDTMNFMGEYSIFQTENFTIDSMNQVIYFYIKFESNIICYLIFNYYDSDSLVDIDTICSEYELTRHNKG